jgi:UDP-N-acetylglucosamine acyltransferase
VIHPQAIVDSGARLGGNVQVGPFSIIGKDVEIGDGTWIGPHVVINGRTRIGYQGEPTRLEIGDRNTIREHCTFSRATVAGGGVTRVGDDNFIMAYCHVAHDCVVGSSAIFANNSSLAGHVHVGDHAVLGGFTMVHQFCRIGAHCMTAVNTAIPHGLNLRGLKRRGFSEAAIEALKRAYKTVYRSDCLLSEALAELEPLAREYPEVRHFTQFIAESERGIIR